MAKKVVKKAARKQAKTQARRPVRRTSPKPKAKRAKAKAASRPANKPVPKRMPVKAAKPAKPAKPAKAIPAKKLKARKVPTRKPAAKAARRMAAPPKSAPPKSVAPKAAKPKGAKPKAAAPSKRTAVPSPPTLQRERRRLPEAEEETPSFTDASEDSRLMSSARAGHDELRSELKQHTETSPTMTAGDVDAKWQDAYALGDEAPGGDNMTPDQDRVDDIGKALGIEYADDEELLGGSELAARDEHRWELDPASKDEDEDL